jgi:hypothetical protein
MPLVLKQLVFKQLAHGVSELHVPVAMSFLNALC